MRILGLSSCEVRHVCPWCAAFKSPPQTRHPTSFLLRIFGYCGQSPSRTSQYGAAGRRLIGFRNRPSEVLERGLPVCRIAVGGNFRPDLLPLVSL